jgi:hypothetical protein
LYSNTSGYGNTGCGSVTLSSSTTGAYNTAVGHAALNDLVTGNYNTAVGYNAGPTSSNPGLSNTTAIGNGASVTASDQVHIGNSSVGEIGGYAPWTDISDARYKFNIRDDVKGLDFILKLRPVTYQLDVNKLAADLGEDLETTDDGISRQRQVTAEELSARDKKSAIVYTGLIAQEVESTAQSIGYDFSGVVVPDSEQNPYGLQYSTLVVPLIKAVQEQQQIIQDQQKQIDALARKIEMMEGK